MKQHDHHTDEFFMRRALELARLGAGHVSPNPMVGCAIVYAGRIIGEGWHKQYGGPHAEVNAVSSVEDKSLLPESTVYVSLEPCNHTGKTPPCSELLIRHRVKKVVIANTDPNPVAVDGAQALRAAGVEVVTGVLEKEGHELNRRFFTWIAQQRPYIILKWAQTADGFVAHENYDSKWISNDVSRQLVHKWRSEEDGILVGSRTVVHDDPQLNVRQWAGRNPVRLVIDRFLRLGDQYRVFDRTQPTRVYNVLKHETTQNLELVRLPEDGFLQALLGDLYANRIQSVIVEGGTHTLQRFLEAGVWDEARVFVSPRTFQKGIAAPVFKGNLIGTESVDTDTLFHYRPHGKS